MSLIKHLCNLMFLWTIPYMIVALLYVLTVCSFSYVACITSGIWAFTYGLYFFFMMIIYMSCPNDKDLQLFKTH